MALPCTLCSPRSFETWHVHALGGPRRETRFESAREVFLKHPTTFVREKIVRIFRDMVSSLKDLPRPDNKNRGVRGKSTLWEVRAGKHALNPRGRWRKHPACRRACRSLDLSVLSAFGCTHR